MNALLAVTVLALLTGQSIFTSAAPTLSGVDIIRICSDVLLANTEIFYESEGLSNSDSTIFKTRRKLIEKSMDEIMRDTRTNSPVYNYRVEALRTFLADIKTEHVKELQELLTKLQTHLSNATETQVDEKDVHIVKAKIRNSYAIIMTKLGAVKDVINYHNRRLLSTSDTAILSQALLRISEILQTYHAKDVPDEQKLGKLEEAIGMIPSFLQLINKLHL